MDQSNEPDRKAELVIPIAWATRIEDGICSISDMEEYNSL